MKLSLFIFIIFIIFSCKKSVIDPPEPMPALPRPDTSGLSLSIKIKNTANGIPIVLGTNTYTTTANDTFQVGVLKYYVTNIVLTNQSGTSYTLSDSYYLINQADSNSCNLNLKNVPENNYISMSFLVGVDAARNTSGAQTGALDPLNGMFWTWNTGYIMAKLEGSSPQSADPSKSIAFHIGGFSGKNNGVRSVTVNFPKAAHVNKAHGSIVLLSADIAKWFSGVHPIHFNTSFSVTNISIESQNIADNYAQMFTVKDIIN